jgi:xanthine dehydrogenase accessory factor
VLAGEGAVVETYGYSDDDAFAVGLTCGGTLEVLVAPADRALLAAWAERMAVDDPVALATVVSGPAPLGAQLLVGPDSALGTLGTEGLDVAVTDDARGMLASGQTGDRHYGERGQRRVDDVTVFVQSFTPPPRMLVFGATDFAAAVSRIGVFLGYRVTVCDARPVFATTRASRGARGRLRVAAPLPRAHRPGRPHVICVLTHDPKFDVPLLEVALRRPAAYVGAMGSRRTHDDRLRRLREVGLTEDSWPGCTRRSGSDLGARTAEETAVSIAAEIVQARWGGSGRPLAVTDGDIHVGHGHAAPAEPVTVVSAAPGRRRAAARRGRGPADGRSQGAGRAGRRTAGAPGDPPARRQRLRAGGRRRGRVGRPRPGRSATARRSSRRPTGRPGWAPPCAPGSPPWPRRAGADACVVALVDQPRVTVEAVRRLRAAHADGAAVAVASYGGRSRNPVLLGRASWAGVAAAAQGDEGARPWLRAHPSRSPPSTAPTSVRRTTSTPLRTWPGCSAGPGPRPTARGSSVKLENRFTVPVPVDQAWRVLLDVERIAPCMPGATLTKVDGDAFEGTVKVKVGPDQPDLRRQGALRLQGRAGARRGDRRQRQGDPRHRHRPRR